LVGPAVDLAKKVKVGNGSKGNEGGIIFGQKEPPAIEGSHQTESKYLVIDLEVGEIARAAVAWSVFPDYIDYALEPSADIDLNIRDISGHLPTYSISILDTLEVVEFGPVTGPTTIKIAITHYDIR